MKVMQGILKKPSADYIDAFERLTYEWDMNLIGDELFTYKKNQLWNQFVEAVDTVIADVEA